MRIRFSPDAVGVVTAGLVHLLARTVRMVVNEWADPRYRMYRPGKRRAIYAFWHGRLLMAALTHLDSQVYIPISRHRDGEYVSQMAMRIGVRPIRGSTGRGGARALREMVRVARSGDICFTPDGPRGPRYVVQPGIIQLARLAQQPIICSALEASCAYVAHSWDEFTIPYPFSRVALCCGAPIEVPRDLDEAGFERVRQHVQDEMLRLGAHARERLGLGKGSPPLRAAVGSRS